LEPVDLNEVLDDFKKLLRCTIPEDVAIEVILYPSLPLVKGDIGQLEQVIMNLTINAQDAMPDGGVLTIEAGVVQRDEVDVSGRESMKPGAYIMSSVSDTGCGMDARTRERIFKPFFLPKLKTKGLAWGWLQSTASSSSTAAASGYTASRARGPPSRFTCP
jgi:signal transduction histidine kinase